MGKHLWKKGLRRCRLCKKLLKLEHSNFYKAKGEGKDFGYECRSCHNNQKKKWRDTLKGKKAERKYRKKYYREKLMPNPKYRIDKSISTAVCISLNGKKAGRKWENLVGYTLEDLIIHLEKQFDNKMSWNNYGSYWWLDHIKARSLFNYISPEDKEFKECWGLKNLQPLEKIENIKKSNYWEVGKSNRKK